MDRTAKGEHSKQNFPWRRRVGARGKFPVLRAIGPLVGASDVSVPLVRARGQAAVVRALLNEMERISALHGSSTREETVLGDQLVEELARLGCRVLECASAMSLTRSDRMTTRTNVVKAPLPDPIAVAAGDDVAVGAPKA